MNNYIDGKGSLCAALDEARLDINDKAAKYGKEFLERLMRDSPQKDIIAEFLGEIGINNNDNAIEDENKRKTDLHGDTADDPHSAEANPYLVLLTTFIRECTRTHNPNELAPLHSSATLALLFRRVQYARWFLFYCTSLRDAGAQPSK